MHGLTAAISSPIETQSVFHHFSIKQENCILAFVTFHQTQGFFFFFRKHRHKAPSQTVCHVSQHVITYVPHSLFPSFVFLFYFAACEACEHGLNVSLWITHMTVKIKTSWWIKGIRKTPGIPAYKFWPYVEFSASAQKVYFQETQNTYRTNSPHFWTSRQEHFSSAGVLMAVSQTHQPKICYLGQDVVDVKAIAFGLRHWRCHAYWGQNVSSNEHQKNS